MILQNPFPDYVRNIYLDCWECWICGQNGTQTGGLELHHIQGRNSYSAFNSAPLCKLCHSMIGHTLEEEKTLMIKTAKYLVKHNYQFTEYDLQFYLNNKHIYDTVT